MSDEFYYQKYLKYKNKYLALKEYEGGGLLYAFETGIIAYFCSTASADLICKDIQEKALTTNKINEILSNEPAAFKGKKGKSEVYFIQKSLYNRAGVARKSAGKSIDEGAKYVGEGTLSAGKSIASGTVSGAKYVGEGTVSGTKFLGRSAVSGVKSIGKKIDSSVRSEREDLLLGGAKDKVKVKVLKDAKGPIIIDTNNDAVLQKIVRGLQKTYPNIDSVVVINYSAMGSICLKKLINIKPSPEQSPLQMSETTEAEF